MVRLIALIFLCVSLYSCGRSQDKDKADTKPEKSVDSTVAENPPGNRITKYMEQHPDNGLPSDSRGNVSQGSLENGKLMPYSGTNFHYFDKMSYTSGRGFVNDKVRDAVIGAYEQLAQELPDRHFCIMECSKQHGGKIWPHRTHQNGLSVDFMMPKLKDGEPYYGLDSTGKSHYLLTFEDDATYKEDSTISLDMDLVARHLLVLDKEARKQGLKITKVIIKTELKDELYSGTYGKKLKSSGVYVVRSLTPLINNLHDDHYHVDFGEL